MIINNLKQTQMQKTTLQKAIEMIDSQMKIVENSKKGKDAKYKFGADAAITNLVMTKITLKGMLQEEREMLQNAHLAGQNSADEVNGETEIDYVKNVYGVLS
jgi:hypothetical protein